MRDAVSRAPPQMTHVTAEHAPRSRQVLGLLLSGCGGSDDRLGDDVDDIGAAGPASS